jgi:ABC-2 type transport system ATP-binding protein
MSLLVRGMSKTYPDGTQALTGVDLDFAGGTLGLVGPNGSGKTTLMRILATLLPPTAGSAEVFGVSIQDRDAVRRMLGYLPQTFGFYPQLSVLETMVYFAGLKGVSDRRRIDTLLETVGLAARRRSRVRGLSGGLRQRLGIAVALLNDPRLLIIDEPTAGLDPEGRVDLRNLISSLPGNRTVIISSHIVEDIAQSASVVAVLFQGNLLYCGSPSGLAEAAENQVWEAEVDLDDLPDLRRSHMVVASARYGERLRVRCIGPAQAGLSPAAPTLEDGFMVLVNRGRS